MAELEHTVITTTSTTVEQVHTNLGTSSATTLTRAARIRTRPRDVVTAGMCSRRFSY